MDLSTAMLGRRSIRKYLDKEVPRKLLEELIQEALWAPSGKNKQPWKVFVYTGEEKDKLLRVFTSLEKDMRVRLKSLFPEKIVNLTINAVTIAGGAPVIVLIYTPKAEHLMTTAGISRAEAEDEYFYSLLSVTALVQNVLLSAYSRGLGSCWMTAQKYIEKEVNEIVGIEDYELIAVIPIGYPNQSPPAPPRKPGVVEWRGF